MFSPGISYVALSRVRSLNGLHLIDFDSAYIIASSSCLEEINRQRGVYRKDLSLYNVPKTNFCKKHRFTVKIDDEAPPSKKRCTDKQNRKQKPSTQDKIPKTKQSKKVKLQAAKNGNDDTGTVSTVNSQCTTWPNLGYYPVNEEWQRQACNVWE